LASINAEPPLRKAKPAGKDSPFSPVFHIRGATPIYLFVIPLLRPTAPFAHRPVLRYAPIPFQLLARVLLQSDRWPADEKMNFARLLVMR